MIIEQVFDEVLRCLEVYYLLLKFSHIPPKEEPSYSLHCRRRTLCACTITTVSELVLPIALAFVPQLVCLLPFFSPALLRLPGGSKYKHVRLWTP